MSRDSWVGVHERQQFVREGSPLSPTPLCLTEHNSVMLRNITIRSWLRYLSPKISNFVLLKIDFWPRQ